MDRRRVPDFVGLARVAAADERHAGTRETRAETLFREGTQKLDAGDVDPACDALVESLRLDSKLGTLLNVALCHEKQGKAATAWGEFVAAAAWATDTGRADRRDFAHQHAEELEPLLSRVQLDLTAIPLALADVDGRRLLDAQLQLPLFLDPGQHVLTVRAPGKRERSVPFTVPPPGPLPARPGHAVQVVTAPALAEAAETVEPPVPAGANPGDTWGARRVVGASVAGSGVVAVGVGAAFAIQSIVNLRDASAHCTGLVCDAQAGSLRSQAATSETVSVVALGAGVAALGAGAWLWLTPRTHPGVGVRVAPVVGTRGGGMSLLGAW